MAALPQKAESEQTVFAAAGKNSMSIPLPFPPLLPLPAFPGSALLLIWEDYFSSEVAFQFDWGKFSFLLAQKGIWLEKLLYKYLPGGILRHLFDKPPVMIVEPAMKNKLIAEESVV